MNSRIVRARGDKASFRGNPEKKRVEDRGQRIANDYLRTAGGENGNYRNCGSWWERLAILAGNCVVLRAEKQKGAERKGKKEKQRTDEKK